MTVDLEPIPEPIGERLGPPETRPRHLVAVADDPTDMTVVERRFGRRIVVGILICTPILAVIYAGLVGLALWGSGAPLAAPLLMGAGVGALAAMFWGFWFAIAATVREMEETDERSRALAASRRQSTAGSPV